MRRSLLILGVILSMGGAAFWALKGAHMGWTQTRVKEVVVDPITEIEQPVWKDRFVPGIDFLAAIDAAGLVLIVGGLLGRRKTNPTQYRRP